jgi:hypothetical protein
MVNIRYGVECPDWLDDDVEKIMMSLIKKCANQRDNKNAESVRSI